MRSKLMMQLSRDLVIFDGQEDGQDLEKICARVCFFQRGLRIIQIEIDCKKDFACVGGGNSFGMPRKLERWDSMRDRKMTVTRKVWKVVLESEPFGREEFEAEPSLVSALVTFNGLIDSAEKEFREDRVPREISLVCVCLGRGKIRELHQTGRRA
jgi:hypothetical protein